MNADTEDSHPSPQESAALSAELHRLGKPHEFHTYDGAGHAFMAVDRPNYRPEAAVEWLEVHLRFLQPPPRHLVERSAPPELHSRAVSLIWKSSAVEFGNRSA